MKSVCFFTIVVLSLLVCLKVSNVEATTYSENLKTKLRSFLDTIGLKRSSDTRHLPRQTGVCTPGNNSACLPPGTGSVPMTLVECLSDGSCACNECFIRNTATFTCQVDSCQTYNSATAMCVDNRRSQLTAFLLSIFLCSTGAANFYIDRNGLAAGQLVLLLITIFAPYILCCLPCCLACCMDGDSVKGSIPFIIVTLITVIVIIIAAFALVAWWIADLVIFAKNERLAGDGCMLSPTL